MSALPQPVELDVAACSRAGRKGYNEDSVFAMAVPDVFSPLQALAVVADGVGGGRGGAEASSAAVIAVRRVLSSAYSPLCAEGGAPEGAGVILDALREADREVLSGDSGNSGLSAGRTTCVAACVCGGVAYIGNVGDSRGYLYRSGELRQLTSDDAVGLGDVGDESGIRPDLTNWLGGLPHAPSVQEVSVIAGDSLLICSDGLYSVVGAERMATILAASSGCEEAVARLMEKSEMFGAEDDVSVAVVSVAARALPEAPAAPPEPGHEVAADTPDWLLRLALYGVGANLVLSLSVLWVMYLLLSAIQR